MLPETITLNYTDAADDVTAISTEYEKRTRETGFCEYRETSTIDQPELPYDRIVARVVEAKTSPSFYGTRRTYVTLRQDGVIPQPTGDRVCPSVFKFENSTPVGFTAVELKNQIRHLRAFINSTEFEDLVVRQET